MCDISREENKAINTQLAMKNIPLNSDVLSIVNSFLFQDKAVYAKHMKEKMEQKQRKDAILDVIKSPIDFDGDIGGYSFQEYPEDGTGYWYIWLPIFTTNRLGHFGHLQLEASNCLKCGKYTQVPFLELESAIMDNKYIVCVNGEH